MNVYLHLLILTFALVVLEGDCATYANETDAETIKTKTGASSVKLENGELILELTNTGTSSDDIYIGFPESGAQFDISTQLSGTHADLGDLNITMSTLDGKEATAELNWEGKTTLVTVSDISQGKDGAEKPIGHGNRNNNKITTIQIDSNGTLTPLKHQNGDPVVSMIPLKLGDLLGNNTRVFLFRFGWKLQKPFWVTFKNDTKILKFVPPTTTTTTTTPDPLITEMVESQTEADDEKSKTIYMFIIMGCFVAIAIIALILAIACYCACKKMRERKQSTSKNKTTSTAITHKSASKEPIFSVNHSINSKELHSNFDLPNQPTLKSEEVFEADKSVKVTFRKPPTVTTTAGRISTTAGRESDGIGSLNLNTNRTAKTAQSSDPPTAQAIDDTFTTNITELKPPPGASTKTADKIEPKQSKSKVDLVEPKLSADSFATAASTQDQASFTGTQSMPVLKRRSKEAVSGIMKQNGSKEAVSGMTKTAQKQTTEKTVKTAENRTQSETGTKTDPGISTVTPVISVDDKGKATETKL